MSGDGFGEADVVALSVRELSARSKRLKQNLNCHKSLETYSILLKDTYELFVDGFGVATKVVSPVRDLFERSDRL